MEVKFTRTGQRRYRVSIEGDDVVSSYMDPAPGYDARLPHDMAHFIVENELGIKRGVFGQVAASGHVGTFTPIDDNKRRKFLRRGKQIAKANQKDALLSEQLVAIAYALWQNKAAQMPPVAGITREDIMRVCREFEAASAVWSKLGVGESMTLVWRAGNSRPGRRVRR